MLNFLYPDFFSEFYPDFGGYLKIFGPYPDSDIYLKKILKNIFVFVNCSKISSRHSALHHPFRHPAFHCLDGRDNILP